MPGQGKTPVFGLPATPSSERGIPLALNAFVPIPLGLSVSQQGKLGYGRFYFHHPSSKVKNSNHLNIQ
jgi:hypothetical protein